MNLSTIPRTHLKMAQPGDFLHIVSDDALRELALHTPERDLGELSPEHLAMASANLSAICAELLAHRAMNRRDPRLPFPTPRNHGEKIANARAAIQGETDDKE